MRTVLRQIILTGRVLDSIVRVNETNGWRTINELRLLNRIAFLDVMEMPTTLSELSRDLGIAKATISTILKRHIAIGTIRRDRDLDDRRKFRLTFTPKAVEITEEWATLL